METNLVSPVLFVVIVAAVIVVAFVAGCSATGGKGGATSGATSSAGTGADVGAETPTEPIAAASASGEGSLVSFSFSEHGTTAEPYFSYKITTSEDGRAVLSYSEDSGQTEGIGYLSKEQLDAIKQAFSEAGMASWDGFRGSNPNVLDGTSFSLSAKFSDGTRLSASGSNRFPTGYRDASEIIREAFDQVIAEGLEVDEGMVYERRYRSFDGGGARYYAVLYDSDVVSYSSYTSRDASYDPEADGSALYYNLRFMAKSPGEVKVAVYADGPLVESTDEPYETFTLTVDDALRISVSD